MNDVPDNIRESLKTQLWAAADRLGWMTLSTTEKSKRYEAWVRDPKIGGILSRFINISDVRVYLKDTLMKEFARKRLADDAMPFRVLGISASESIRSFTQPHGRELTGGRIVVWGRANEWKTILMAAFERAYTGPNLTAHAAILTHAVGRFKQDCLRKMVGDAAKHLNIERIEWID